MSTMDKSLDASAHNDNLSISLPKEYTGKDIFFKVQQKKKHEPHVQKFRSFNIFASNLGSIQVRGKLLNIIHLFNLLKEHGLTETLPTQVILGPLTFINFDWHPIAYNGPTVWSFTWNDVECSITSSPGTNIYIRIHDLTPGVAEKILDEISDELYKHWKDPVPNKSLIIYTTQLTAHGFQWIQNCTRLQRDMDTIYINKEIKNKLINQLTKFYSSSEIYDRYGVTWKRVHLFHGPPGSGKTSTILALASIFQKNIAKLTVSPELNSQNIERLFQTIPAGSFILLEDVDALFTERKSNTSIDFSTLLNCMDGLTTQRGLTLFMTTNHITQLDAAFIRPGRVDISLEFKLPGREELHEALKVLGSDYEHEHEEFLDKHSKDMSIASLQKHLFECIMEEKKSILF